MFTAASVGLLVLAIAGIAPFISGGSVGECSENGPHSIFLFAWGASAAFGIASAIYLSTGYGQPKGPRVRRAAFWAALLVPVGAVALYVVLIVDGISECGF